MNGSIGGAVPRRTATVHDRRDPGSSIGSPAAHCGHSAGSYDSIGKSSSACVGTPKSASPRITMTPTPATCAPCARTTSITSRTDSPVVTTSSTTSARSVGAERKAAAQHRRAALFLDEDRFGAELARDFVAEHDAADGGAHDDGRPHCRETHRRSRAPPVRRAADLRECGTFE